MNILEKIVAAKKRELLTKVAGCPVEQLYKNTLFGRDVIPLSDYILDKKKTGIIAEFKRKSPSKGIINLEPDIEKVIFGYCCYGASGISVLTDNEFFGGCNDDLSLARQVSEVPILRKDFIIDEYQIIEARAIGADAILLIAAALDKNIVLRLASFARSLNLQVLLEIHNRSELDAANEYVNIIGVNNRDLTTFKVNTDISVELADVIPSQFLKISESGITSPDVIRNLKNAGYNGFLIGGAFMQKADPVAAFSDFVTKTCQNHG